MMSRIEMADPNFVWSLGKLLGAEHKAVLFWIRGRKTGGLKEKPRF